MNSVFESDFTNLPCLKVKDMEVVEISQSFVDFTGFLHDEILFKNVSEVFAALRMPYCGIYENNEDKEYFLFTKSLKPRQVRVLAKKDGQTLSYCFAEIPNTRLEVKFPGIYGLYKDNHTGVGIFSMPDLVLLKANEAFIKAYGIDRSCISMRMEQFIENYRGSDYEKIMKEVQESGNPYYLNNYKFETDSHLSYWKGTIVPIYEGSKLKYCIQTIDETTSEIIENNNIVNQQKKRFEIVFENMSDGFIIFDRNNDIVEINKAARHIFLNQDIRNIYQLQTSFKYSDSDGKPIEINEMPSSRIAKNEIVEDCEISIRYSNEDRYFCVSGAPVYDEDGSFIMGILNIKDITKQTQYKKALKEQNDFLFRMIDVLNFPIIRVSYPELKITGVNVKGYEFIIDITKAEAGKIGDITGKSIYTLISSIMIDNFGRKVRKMARDGKPLLVRDTKVTINEKDYYYNFLLQPVAFPDTDFNEFMMICIDITDEILQKQATENVMKMQEEFFTYIAHEFKTPLTAMNSTIQFMELLHSSEMNDNIKKNVNRLKRNTYQQLRLVNNLLDIIKAQSGYLKVYKSNFDIVELTRVITESIYEFAQIKDIEIVFNSLIDSRIIAIDDEKYERILLNILSNAIKYTPNHKKISITIYSRNKNVYISIKDEGVGIPKDKLEKIFERFEQVGNSLTRCSEGTGIGLCLAKLLVKAMDGDISVKSEENCGTEFIISLPDCSLDKQESPRIPEITEGRLVRTMNVEFSNIYLD